MKTKNNNKKIKRQKEMTKRHISQLFHGGGRVRSREAHREREMLFHLSAASHCTNFQVRLFNFVITFHGECQDSVLRTPLLFIVYVGQGRHPMKKLCFFWALPKLSPLRAVCKGSILLCVLSEKPFHFLDILLVRQSWSAWLDFLCSLLSTFLTS